MICSRAIRVSGVLPWLTAAAIGMLPTLGVTRAENPPAGASWAQAGSSPHDARLKVLGISPDAEGLIGYLRSLDKPDPIDVDTLIRQLGDSKWRTREQATVTLINARPAPLAELRDATKSADEEVVVRTERILQAIQKRTGSNQAPEKLRLALAAIRQKRISRALGLLLEKFDELHDEYPSLPLAQTILACSSKDNAQLLRKALIYPGTPYIFRNAFVCSML
jgi:hypothetical protein